VVHPFVFGELLLGGLSEANEELLHALKWCEAVPQKRTFRLIKSERLAGRRVGWVDAAVIASAIELKARVATLDESLARCAVDAGCAYPLDSP
jgi:hypothetical protein